MSLLYTVDDLVLSVRQQLDEQNRDAISTELDILPTLNRASLYAFDILSRKYPEPILKHVELPFVAGQSEYPIPNEVFEDRILKLETEVPLGQDNRSNFIQIDRISYRDLSQFESVSPTSFPLYYCIIGRMIRVIPQPSGYYSARMWYVRDPEKLVLPQGRVTLLNTVGNYVILDQAGSLLTTESDQLGSYVNVIDGQTGEIKGTLQIQSQADSKITFRTVPTRTTVLGKTVGGSLAATNCQQDDYLSPVDGSCVPYYGRPVCNFLIQFAVAELVRKLGGQSATEEDVLKKFEQQVERTWAGRQISLRVKKKSNNWGAATRRYSWYWSK